MGYIFLSCTADVKCIICKITPDVIRYNRDRTRKPFDNSCDEYRLCYGNSSSALDFKPRSPYFEINNGCLSCIKTLDEYTQKLIIYQIHNRDLQPMSGIDIRHLRYVSCSSSNKGNMCSERWDLGGHIVKWRNVYNVGANSRRHGMIKITPKVRRKYKSVNSYIYRNRHYGYRNTDYTPYFSSSPYENWSMMRI